MQSFRAAGVAAALLVGVACGKTAGVAPSGSPSPEASASGSTTMASGDSRACAPRDASKPDRRPTVAVMYFDNGALSNRTDFAPLSKGIADMMTVALRANCGIRVVEREQLQRLLTEQNIPADRIDVATRVRIGKLLGAKHMVMGAFVVDLRDQMVMTASAIDVETSEHEADVSHKDATKNLLDMVPVLAKKLNDAMRLPPMQTPTFEGSRPPKRDDELLGLRLYSRALEEQDRGNKPRASELYRAALEKFPAYGPAQLALRKLQAGG
ncbi:MAG: CsgG/HfaB family protein [Gemmatimonadaceae bacterium]